jgi:hypothetical protein
MKKKINEIETLIKKVIDKKRSINMIDDANILESKLEFFLKGFEVGSGLHLGIYFQHYIDNLDDLDEIKKIFISEEESVEVDVPEEWIRLFEESESEYEYQNYLKLKDKYDTKVDSNKIETNNYQSENNVEVPPFNYTFYIYIAIVLVIFVLIYYLNK